MPIDYDLKTDERYLQGKDIGIAKGIEKGEVQQATKSVKGVHAKFPHLSNQEIAELLQVSRKLVDQIIKRD